MTTILTATATYTDGEPAQGLHRMTDLARKLGAEIQVDSDQGDVRIMLTLTEPGEARGHHGVAATLAALADALPPGAATETASWRQTGPIPF